MRFIVKSIFAAILVAFIALEIKALMRLLGPEFASTVAPFWNQAKGAAKAGISAAREAVNTENGGAA